MSSRGAFGLSYAGRQNFCELTPVKQYHSMANCKKILKSRGIRIPGISRFKDRKQLNVLVERSKIGVLHEFCEQAELLRFCNQRGLSVNAAASASKPELILTLRHADATPTFEHMQDLPTEIKMMIFDFYYAPLQTNSRNQRNLHFRSNSPPIPPPVQQACMWLWPECAEPYYQECEVIVEVNCIWDSDPIRFSQFTKRSLAAMPTGVFKYIREILVIGPALAEEETRLKTAWKIDLDEKDTDQELVQVGLPWNYLKQSRLIKATAEIVYKALQGKVKDIQRRGGNKTLLKTDVVELKEVFVKLLTDHGSAPQAQDW